MTIFSVYFKATRLAGRYGGFVYTPGTNLYLKAAERYHSAEVFPTCPLPAKTEPLNADSV